MTFTEDLDKKIKAAVATHGMGEQEKIRLLIQGIVTSLTDLTCVHFKEINDLTNDNDAGKASFSLGVKIDVSDKQAKVTTKISFSRKTSDSMELPVELPIDIVRAED